jgi:hypothetical protein
MIRIFIIIIFRLESTSHFVDLNTQLLQIKPRAIINSSQPDLGISPSIFATTHRKPVLEGNRIPWVMVKAANKIGMVSFSSQIATFILRGKAVFIQRRNLSPRFWTAIIPIKK